MLYAFIRYWLFSPHWKFTLCFTPFIYHIPALVQVFPTLPLCQLTSTRRRAVPQVDTTPFRTWVRTPSAHRLSYQSPNTCLTSSRLVASFMRTASGPRGGKGCPEGITSIPSCIVFMGGIWTTAAKSHHSHVMCEMRRVVFLTTSLCRKLYLVNISTSYMLLD